MCEKSHHLHFTCTQVFNTRNHNNIMIIIVIIISVCNHAERSVIIDMYKVLSKGIDPLKEPQIQISRNLLYKLMIRKEVQDLTLGNFRTL